MNVENGTTILDTVFIGLRCLNGIENLKAYDVVQFDACNKCNVTIPCSLFYKKNVTTGVWEEYTPLPTDIIGDEPCTAAAPTKYDYEKELLCEKITGRKVLIESRVDEADPTQARQGRVTYLVGGAVFAGDVELDLENCADTDVKSDPETMCDNGTTFMRWYEQSNGVPTTNFYDRTIGYAVYTPVGPITPGPCNGETLSIGSELLNVSGVSTLTPTVGAVYAVISVNEGEAWITVDGTTPVVGDSHPAYEGQYVYLQIADELVDFQAIGNPTAKLYVTYFDKPLLLSQI